MKYIIRLMLALIFLFYASTIYAAGKKIKDVHEVVEERSNLCWAAICECIYEIDNNFHSQCEIQDTMNVLKGFTSDCCDTDRDKEYTCNQLNSLHGEVQSVDEILYHMHNIESTYIDRILIENEVVETIATWGNPFIMTLTKDEAGIPYTGGVVHYVLCFGYKTNEEGILNYYLIMDPEQTVNPHIVEYNASVFGNRGWLNTLRVDKPFEVAWTEDPATYLEYFSPIIVDNNIVLKWKTTYEDNTDYFIIEKYNRHTRIFHSIAIINSCGTNSLGYAYEYVDEEGKYDDYYRIIEIDNMRTKYILALSRVRNYENNISRQLIIENTTKIKDVKNDTKYIINNYGTLMRPAYDNTQWLAIYPDSFESAIQDLMEHRFQMSGLTTNGQTLEYIYAQYGSGFTGIKNYIQNIWDNEDHSLEYVVLVGDVSLYHPTETIIPTKIYYDGPRNSQGTNVYASDLELGDIDNDGYAEIPVGRIPARNIDNVINYVNKVVNYENLTPGYWKEDISFFINAKNQYGCSEELVNELADSLISYIPSSYDLYYNYVNDSLYLEGLHYPERRTISISEFNNKRAMMLCFGTAAEEDNIVGWMANKTIGEGGPSPSFNAGMLNTNDVFPFIIGSCCEINNIGAHRLAVEIVQDLLLSYNNRGAICSFGPTGGSWQNGNYLIARYLLQYLYEYGAPSLGYASMAAQKRVMGQDNIYKATARSYVFLGDPAIKLFGSIISDDGELPNCLISFDYPDTTKKFLLSCPEGDGDTLEVDVKIEFDFNPYDIPAESVTIGNYSYNNLFTVFYDDCNTVFKPDPLPADQDADYSNNYTTSFTLASLSGCGFDTLTVRLDGDSLSQLGINVKSCDLDNDGKVNVSDLGIYGQSHNCPGPNCVPPKEYNDCCDFTGDSLVNLSDYGVMGVHYSDEFTGCPDPMLSNSALLSDVAIDILCEPYTISDQNRLKLYVSLRRASDVSLVCIGLKSENALFRYEESETSAEFKNTVLVAPVVNRGNNILFISSFGEYLLSGELVEMVELDFAVNSKEQVPVSSDDFKLVFGDIMDKDGVIKRIRGIDLQYANKEMPIINNLACNYPNPFNPTTTIEYSISNDSFVKLSIYNVAGQLVRTLVNEHKKRNNYKVIWDGKDNRGISVASGVYFYRLKAEQFVKTKKLVILR